MAINFDLDASFYGSSDRYSFIGTSENDFAWKGYSGIASYNLTTESAANNTPTFFINGHGKSVTDFGMNDTGYSIGLQADGKILVAGESIGGFNSDFALARYNVDGSLDLSFSGDGKLTTDCGGSDYCCSITIQSDGQILAAGVSDNHFTLARYNTDGTLDTSFSDDGKVTTDILLTSNADTSVVQVDGKILLAGGNNADFVLVRFNMDGTLDTTFSDDGKVTTDFDGGTDLGSSIVVQPDEKILVAGSSSGAFALARYNTDGTLDATFSDDGKLTTGFATGIHSWSSGESVTFQPADGKILVAGMTYNADAWRYDFALARYNTDGTLDTSFDGDGKVTTGLSQYDKGYSVVVQSDGKILVAGGAQWGASWEIAVVRYNMDGTLDTSFDGDGRVTTRIYDYGWTSGFDMKVQADGKILVAGRGESKNNYDFVLVRYNTDGSLDTGFGKINSLDAIHLYTKYGTPVVLDSDVQIYDADLAMAENYSGATLSLSRHGGANSNDLFSAKRSGTLGALNDGSNLTIGGLSIGVINTNSEGLLEITFNDYATQSLVNSVLQQIAYSNNFEASTATVQIDWTFSDGNTGNQGAGGVLRVTGSTFTEFNNAPTGTVVITGSAVQGDVLTASNTLEDLDGLQGASFHYLWKADGVFISDGYGNTSTICLTQNEVGKHITVEAGYFDDLSNYETVSSQQTVLVKPEGTTSPTVLTITPAEGTSEVDVSSNIVLTFNEAITLGAGSIVIHSGSVNGTVVEDYDVATSGNLSISENALTINPTANLAGSMHYYVTLDAGSINDFAGNGVVGSTYDFTTNGPIVETETLFSDEFNSQLNAASWDYNHWQPVNNPSFYGRTQQRQSLSVVSDGKLHLELDTYNPTNGSVPSFYGSEAITKETFSIESGGVSFEIKAHFVNPVDGGIVGGMFTYSLNSGNLHDEIDFEAVSNKPVQIQTNIYANEPLGAGHPQFNPIFGALTDTHIYRIEWFKNAIRWFVDGQLVRVETDYIPQQAMALHLNIWAPAADWIEAYNGALNPVTDPSDNTAYFFDIDSVRVARLSSTYYYSDVIAPNLISANPVDGATNVAVGNDIVFTFSEAIQRGVGTIEIHSGSAAGPVIESYNAATSGNLTINGNELTINPTADLARSTQYFVTFTEGSIKDMAGNSYAGTTTYDFTTDPSMVGGSAESWLYLASWPDLMAAFGVDSNAAAWHYNTYGKNEGREITFDAWGYLASYNDLRGAFGSDFGAAAKHYVEFGSNEGRSITFDAWGYLASYNDLRGAFGTDTAAATKHYVEYGANEGRTITFDAEAYLAAYPDLQAAFGTDTAAATRHYVEYGANEGRTIPATAAAPFIETLSATETATELLLDTIQDFTTGQDQIDLSGIDANTDLDGDQSFSGPLLGESDPFTQAGQLRYHDTEGILYGNTDSDLDPEFTIELIGVPALELADLIL